MLLFVLIIKLKQIQGFMLHISNQIQTNILNLRNQIIPSLTPQVKKILIIAGTAFSFLAALYLIRKHFSASKPQEELIKESPNQRHTPTQHTPEDPDLQKPQPPPVTPTDSPTMPIQDNGDTDLAQNEADTKRAQEEADAKKAQEEADTKKAQERAAEDRKAQKIVNILLVGRTGSGKSTLMKVLQDTFNVTPSSSNSRSTREPELSEFKLGEYQLRILDTPGLCEHVPTSSGQIARSNDEIAALIDDHVHMIFGGYEYLDSAVFACSVPSGVLIDDVYSIKEMLSRISPPTKKLFMVTYAESLPKKELQKIREQLVSHKDLAIQKNFGGTDNFLFSGSLTPDDLLFEDNAKGKLTTIANMKEAVIEALIGDRMTEQEKADGKKARIADFKSNTHCFLDDNIIRDDMFDMLSDDMLSDDDESID